MDIQNQKLQENHQIKNKKFKKSHWIIAQMLADLLKIFQFNFGIA